MTFWTSGLLSLAAVITAAIPAVSSYAQSIVKDEEPQTVIVVPDDAFSVAVGAARNEHKYS